MLFPKKPASTSTVTADAAKQAGGLQAHVSARAVAIRTTRVLPKGISTVDKLVNLETNVEKCPEPPTEARNTDNVSIGTQHQLNYAL